MRSHYKFLLVGVCVLLLIVSVVFFIPDPKSKLYGTWSYSEAFPGGVSISLEWNFDRTTFKLVGYPPLQQTGNWRLDSMDGDTATITLFNQKGDLATKDRTIKIQLGDKTIIDSQGPYTHKPQN